MSGRTLVWLRHGRTAWNVDGRFQGQLDPPLDEVGEAQARAAGAHLVRLSPAVVVASDLQRAARTARALAERAGLPLRLDERLREIDLGAWQGLTRAQVQERFPDEWLAWGTGHIVRRGNGETYAEVGVRAAASALDVVADVPDGGTAVVVAHGGTIRAGLGTLLDLPEETWSRLGPLGNCCWSTTTEGDRGWRLHEHGVRVPEPSGSEDAVGEPTSDRRAHAEA